MATLYEYYNTNDDNKVSIYGANWCAQTFTPSTAHKITSVKLLLYRLGLPGEIAVGIKATDVSGHPTGEDLCAGTTDGDTLPTNSPYEWREITLGAGFNLDADTQYAIVVAAVNGTSLKTLYWRCDATDPTYAGGCLEYSSNSGEDWTGYDQDMMFEDWGEAITPPAEGGAQNIMMGAGARVVGGGGAQYVMIGFP